MVKRILSHLKEPRVVRCLSGAAKDMLTVWLTLRYVKKDEGIGTGTCNINGPRWTF